MAATTTDGYHRLEREFDHGFVTQAEVSPRRACSAKKLKPRRKLTRTPFPDLHAILYRFSEARCVLACVAGSLEELEDPHTPELPPGALATKSCASGMG
jgi:hypothetical protein